MTVSYSYKYLSNIVFSLTLTLLSCHTAAQSSPAEAAEIVKQRTGGKVLKIKTQKDSKYRVKVLLPTGQVKTVNINKKKRNTKKTKNSQNNK